MKKDWKVLVSLVMGLVLMLLLGYVTSYIGYQKIDELMYEQLAGIVGRVVAQNSESEVAILQSRLAYGDRP